MRYSLFIGIAEIFYCVRSIIRRNRCESGNYSSSWLQECVSRETVSTWHDEKKQLIHTCASKRELVHLPLPVRRIAPRNISPFCLFVRNISTDFFLLPVIGNMSIC